jgi:transposase
MLPPVELCIKRMLGDRSLSSSKYYPELPCIISKSLIAKYQRNHKLKAVTNVVLPICGDKGRQIKWDGSSLRIPAIFKRETIPFAPDRAPVRDDEGRVNLSGEFFHRNGEWYLALSYKTATIPESKPTGMIGVDRNSVGAVATLADPTNGKVLHLGFNPAATKACWRGRKKNLQKQGKRRLLAKLRRKQSRITRHQNHIVSRENRGLRQNALSRHRARRSRRSQVERLKDSLVHRAVPVVVLSASPIHRVQGRFVRRDGLRGLGSILLARVLTLPRVNETRREEIRLRTLWTQ